MSGKKETLHGYWVSKKDPSVTICIDRVFKKGYVTGFKYTKIPEGTVHGQLKISTEELLEQYERDNA
jgi:hypothetical protein